ncbi:MAG: hypothetical protein JNM88_07590 [Chitinophagaceae bacterium]|nr:hypothetical protein [Chitinophagaceae bacterium]
MNLPNQAKPVRRNRFGKKNLASLLPSSEEAGYNDAAEEGDDSSAENEGYEGNDDDASGGYEGDAGDDNGGEQGEAG